MQRVPRHCLRFPLAPLSIFLLAIGMVQGLVACGSDPPNPLEDIEGLADLYENAGREKVVRVFGLKASGKGVVLGNGSWILTGSHLVGEATDIRVEDVNLRGATAKIVAVDGKLGLALLHLDDMRYKPAELRVESIPEAGDDIYLIVEDELVGLAPASGQISGRRDETPGDLLRLSGFVAEGEFGGAVFDRSGFVVGVVIPDVLVDRKVRASYAQSMPAIVAFLRGAGGPTH
ncbi:MAG: S1-C subfamily serine protease [Gammaproteobacteria bacterium]|jgi:S1-C subfamily serine protease